ncbi:Conserved_hypothetical protein [Hexamita inflata]|uniref:Brinker DNA-binding domain-containing protein n=1 Tax=Hexamita inflata TaxID=28002 RepID=A0AA86UGA3_9EUKA|nr:Conserved hypothetical protein [Hexamita inflata]CAI9950771.1 Conserved hypothetical protein [Hexamita inflata]
MNGSKKSYTIEFKNSILDQIEQNPSVDLNTVARQYNMQPKTIQNWIDQKEALRQAKDGGDRLRLQKNKTNSFVIKSKNIIYPVKQQKQQLLHDIDDSKLVEPKGTEEFMSSLGSLLDKVLQ